MRQDSNVRQIDNPLHSLDGEAILAVQNHPLGSCRFDLVTIPKITTPRESCKDYLPAIDLRCSPIASGSILGISRASSALENNTRKVLINLSGFYLN